MSKRLAFVARLRRFDQGLPPGWTTAEQMPGARFYFESPRGEQWVALVEHDRLVVTSGEIEWSEHVALTPEWDELWKSESLVEAALDLDLEPPERLWLRAVCLVGAMLHGKELT